MSKFFDFHMCGNAVLFFDSKTGSIVEIPEKEIILNNLWKMIVDEYCSYVNSERELNDNILIYKFLSSYGNDVYLSELFALINEIPLKTLFENLGCGVFVENKLTNNNINHNNLLLKIKSNNYNIFEFSPKLTIDCSKLVELFIQNMSKNGFNCDMIKTINNNGMVLSKLFATFYKQYFNKLFDGSGLNFSNSDALNNNKDI